MSNDRNDAAWRSGSGDAPWRWAGGSGIDRRRCSSQPIWGGWGLGFETPVPGPTIRGLEDEPQTPMAQRWNSEKRTAIDRAKPRDFNGLLASLLVAEYPS